MKALLYIDKDVYCIGLNLNKFTKRRTQKYENQPKLEVLLHSGKEAPKTKVTEALQNIKRLT